MLSCSHQRCTFEAPDAQDALSLQATVDAVSTQPSLESLPFLLHDLEAKPLPLLLNQEKDGKRDHLHVLMNPCAT